MGFKNGYSAFRHLICKREKQFRNISPPMQKYFSISSGVERGLSKEKEEKKSASPDLSPKQKKIFRKSLPVLRKVELAGKKKVPSSYSQKSMKAAYEKGAILCSSEKVTEETGITQTEMAIKRLKQRFQRKLLRFTEKNKPKSGWEVLSPTRAYVESPVQHAHKGEIQTIPENTEERSTSPTNADTDRQIKPQTLFHTPKQPKPRLQFSRSQTLLQLQGGSYCTPVGSSDKQKAKIVVKRLKSLIENTEKESEKKVLDSLVKSRQFPDEEPEVPDFQEHVITSQVKKEMQKMKVHFKNGRRYSVLSMSSSPSK